jgi:DNA-binding response OmpR family regulator
MVRKRILVVEDNTDMAELVAMHLRDEDYDVSLAGDGLGGLDAALGGGFDLVILDLMLPGMDGITVCRRLREQNHYMPVLMLTAKSTEFDRVLGLEIGADDYLTKPFSIRELLARVKAIFRRVDALAETDSVDLTSAISVAELYIDPDRRAVTLDAKEVDLTAKEFDLLLHFARHPGRVYTRSQLLDSVWGYGHEGYEHTVNSHINRLRAKIERDPSQPRFIQTVWGVGYKFADTSSLAND